MPKWNAEYPWERQKGESEKAYEAFDIYCKMGEKRTVIAVCKQLDKSRTLLDRWKDRWDWQERVRAYDNYLVQKELEETKKERANMIKRHVTIAIQFQAKALAALRGLSDEALSPKEIREYIKMATELERLSRALTAEAETDDVVYQMEIEDLDDVESDIYG
jgi:hypothetical protein